MANITNTFLVDYCAAHLDEPKALIAEILEPLCAEYSTRHKDLQEILTDLETAVQTLRGARQRLIDEAMRKVASAHTDLKSAIEASPHLWKKPRTRVFHGVKVGMQKGKGKIIWTDAALVVQRIKEVYEDSSHIFIKTKETPAKEALENLSEDDLKKLDVSVVEAGDQIVIRMVDSEGERINALLKADLEEVEEAA